MTGSYRPEADVLISLHNQTIFRHRYSKLRLGHPLSVVAPTPAREFYCVCDAFLIIQREDHRRLPDDPASPLLSRLNQNINALGSAIEEIGI